MRQRKPSLPKTHSRSSAETVPSTLQDDRDCGLFTPQKNRKFVYSPGWFQSWGSPGPLGQNVKKADWRGNKFREKEVRIAIKSVLGGDEQLVDSIFEIVKAQSDY